MPFVRLQFRRGSASQWTSANPILADGELAIESDTNKFKIGNGNANWTLLPYGGLVGPTGAIGSIVPNDISFNGNIFVGRDVSFGSKLTVRNDVSFNTELRVGGNLNIRSGTASISSGTGALIVNGGVGVGGNVWTGGNLNVALDTSLSSRLLVGGNVLLSSNLIVGVDASFNGNTTFAFLPFYGGNPSVTPALNQLVTKKYVDENGGTILLGANNTWTGNNTFNGSRFYVGADASFNGNLVVREDVSFNKRLFVGGDSSFNSNLTVREDVSFNKRLFVGGDASFNGNLVVRGDVSFNDNMSVQSDSSFNNRLYVGKQIGIGVTANAAYALDVFGNIHMSGNLFLNNKLFSITSSDISLNANLSVGADSSFNGNVFVAKTLNLRKTVLTGGAIGSPTSIVATTPIVELTGLSASAAYFTLANGSYAGQTLTINSATNGGGGGLFVTGTASNIIFNGLVCPQMRFSNAFQTVNLIWSSDATDWIVTSWQGVNFSEVSINFGTYTSGDITLGAAGKVNISPGAGLGGMVVGSESSFAGNLSANGMDSSFNSNVYVGVGKRLGIGRLAGANYLLDVGGNINLTGNLYTNGVLFSAFDNSKDISLNANLTVGFDSSFNANLYVGRRLTVGGGDVSLNQRLTVGGADSSFNGNLYVGGFLNVNGYVNADSYTEKFVNVASSSGTYTADFAGGLILYVNAFSGTSTPTLSITNLPTILNQSYVFTVVYSGAPTSTYFSSLNINGVSVPVNGTVSLSAATSYYVHQFCIFFTDAAAISNNFVVQNFNSSAPVSLVSPLISGNLSVNGNINLTGGNIFQNGTLFVGGGGGSVGPNLSLAGNLYVGGDVSFNGKLYGNGDVSFNANVNVGGNVNFRGNLYQNGVLFAGTSTTGTFFNLSGTAESTSKTTGALTVVGGAGIGGNIWTGGNVVVGSAIQSATPTTGALIVVGGAGVGGNVEVGGNIEIASTLASTSSTTGSLIVRGGAGIVGNVNVGSAIQSVSAITGAFTVVGGAGVGGNVHVGGNVKINSAISSTSSSTGALIVGGGVGIDGALYTNNNINTSGVINTTNSGAAVSSSTGAIIVNGGIGVGGNVQLAGIIRTTLTTASTSTSTGSLIVGGGVGVGGNVYAGGSLYVTGSIVSPSLTGTPTAPTATGGGTGSTQIATTEYVRGEISALIGGAGPALDTLLELGNALGSDLAFSTTVTNSIALKAPINNPTFTGTVGGITKSMVGLPNVDNTSDASKPVSTATQAALDLKANIANPTFTGIVSTPTLSVTGLTESTSKITGALIVSGGAGIAGNVKVGGNVDIAANLYVANNIEITNGTLRLNNGVMNKKLVLYEQSYSSNVDSDGFYGFGINSFTFRYQAPLDGSHKFYSGSVDGSVRCGNINITNNTVSSSAATGALIVTGGAGVGGAVYVGSATQSSTPTNGAFVVTGGAGIGGNVEVGGNVEIASTLASTSSTTGSLIVRGGAGVVGNLWVGSAIESASKLTGALVVGGGVGIAGNVSVGGNVNFVGDLYKNGTLFAGGGSTTGTSLTLSGVLTVNDSTGSTSTSTGALKVPNGGVGIGGAVNIGGVVNITNNTLSTSTTSGALVVTGGIGCGEDLFVNNNIETGTNSLIRFANNAVNKKLVLHDDGVNDNVSTATQFFGFGINGGLMRYQVSFSNFVHKFYSGTAAGIIECGPITAVGTITATLFNATSDYRIKHNVRSICDDPSFNVDVLRPITYTNSRAGKQDIGFIAHEVGEHYPYLVNGEKDGEQMQSLNYTGIIGILVKEIQELKKEIQELKKETQELKKRVADFKPLHF